MTTRTEKPEVHETRATELSGIGEVSRLAKRGPPPLHLWNPPYCGEIDIRIASDGTWFYGGTPIGRKPLVRLFASVLIRKDDDYFLITPVEKVGIRVEDVPFQAISLKVEAPETPEQQLIFTTNVGDEVTIGENNPLRFVADNINGGLKPYVMVRDRLEALVNRPVTYDLVEMAETSSVNGTSHFGVRSGGQFYPMALSDEVEVS